MASDGLRSGRLILGALVGITVLGLGVWGLKTSQGPTATYHATWYVAHTPDNERLIKLAHEFGDRLASRSNGRLTLDLRFPPEQDHDGPNFNLAIQKVLNNEAQISQISVENLASLDPEWQVFDLPFLFRTHTHAAKVFDGDIGQSLRDHLLVASNQQIRPLSFTYSGGYRVFTSNKPLNEVAQLKDLRIHFYGPSSEPMNDISKNYYETRLRTILALQMKPVLYKEHTDYYSQLDFFKNNNVDIAEDHFSHFTRLFQKIGVVRGKMDYFWETQHSLFLTSIVTNEKFYQSLPDDLKTILREETQRLAVLERTESIKTDDDAKQWLINSGYKIQKLSDGQRAEMIRATRKVYDQLGDQIGQQLIHQIEALGEQSQNSIAGQ